MKSEKERLNYSTGVAWEPLRGYSRAVRVGDNLYVSGTTAVKANGDVAGAGDPYEQTRYIIAVLRHIVREAGFQLTDVVRTRMFITDMSQWKAYARAHREVFETIRPASSIVEVQRLVDPRLLIEMELEAVLGCHLVDTLSVKPVDFE